MKQLKFTIIWLIVLSLTALMALSSTITLSKSGLLAMNGLSTQGTISFGAGSKPFISFTDRMGRNHISGYSSLMGWTLNDQESVIVIYNPQDPDELNINSMLFLYGPGFIGLFLALILGLVAYLNVNWSLLIALITGNKTTESTDRKNESVQPASQNSTLFNPKSSSSMTFSSNEIGDIFGPLKPLIEDNSVSDIMIASFSTVFVKRGSQVVKTDVSFPSLAKYEQFADRLLAAADCSYSIAKPIVDGMVTPMVRIHAVHKVLCEEGPYLTLRVSRHNAIRYKDLCASTIAPREVLSYLRASLLTGNTILIAGEVGTGKTTLIRGLASTIPHGESILVIEDTPEIKIEHPVVRYVRTRESNTEGVGEISPAECIRAGMRMAMNRIIFGEIRDPEAAESFIDVCVSGHPGMCTIHSRSAFDTIARLELLLGRHQKGVERAVLREQIGAAVQVIVYTQICKFTGQRRISEVLEVDSNPQLSLKTQHVFQYSVSNNKPLWRVVNKTSFLAHGFKDFESGYSIENLPEWLTLPEKAN